MPQTNTIIRSLHDIGLAGWFGGSLMGAIGLNGAAASVHDEKERTEVASAGWAKWAPVNAVAIGMYAVGGIGLILNNKGRIAGQKGVAGATVLKSAFTAAALGATAYAGVVGKQISDNSGPAAGATEPNDKSSDALAKAQSQEKLLQWAIPASTAILLLLSARMGEQQRPMSVLAGAASRLSRN